MPRASFVCALAVSLLGCSGEGTVEDDDASSVPLVGAAGVTITQVAIYQGLKRVLVQDGVPGAASVPLIAGREALIRVFYTADPAEVGKPVTARLAIAGRDPIELPTVLGAGSLDGDIASTMNFAVPGDWVGDVLQYRTGVMVAGSGSDDNPAARYPAEGDASVAVEGPRNTLRVVLSPFAYHADGSGRLPDVSEAMVQRYRERLLQLYPVSNVEISVRQPVDWYEPIERNGNGWQAVGFQLYGFRNQDGASDDVYYYGVFNPAATFGQFCGFGCLLGVTLLNSNPPETGSVDLRLALGVGFDDVAVDTAAHELGHSHGRSHAPCGDGLDPQSIDFAYPHAGGTLGTWGWDIVNQQLIDPSWTDIMGYCDQQWVSDYTFNNLFNRGRNVNLPQVHGELPASRYALLAVDDDGKVALRSTTTRRRPVGGQPVRVEVRSKSGARRDVSGRYLPWDHLPGGWVFVPVEGDEATFSLPAGMPR